MQKANDANYQKRILIVDADEQVTAVLELKLRQLKYEVMTLASTVNALAAIREFLPHLIISEMVLPELSGVDFLKRIKMNPETAHIPFIFLSSSRNVEDKIIAHEMGAEAFFAKPIFIKVLINRITDFFEERDFKDILSSSGEQEQFSGLLQNISVIDLLNIIRENRRSGVITLTAANGETGAIHFSDGALIRIEKEGSENKGGEELLYTFLPWLDGSFRIVYGEVPAEPNVTEPFDRLIVNAMNWLAEYQSELSEMPALDVTVHLQFPAFIEQLAKLPDTIGTLLREVPDEGIRVGELIERTGDDRKRTIEYIKKLISLGILGYEPCSAPYHPATVPAWFDGDPHPPRRAAPQVAPSPALPGDDGDIRRAKVAPAPVTILQPPADAPAPGPVPAPAPPPPAPIHRETIKLNEDEERRALIAALEEEPAPARQGHGRTLLIFAILVSLAAAGFALWYFMFRPANAPLPLEPAVEAVAAPEPPPPPAPVKPKDPYEGKSADELLALGAAAHGAEKYTEAVALYRAALAKVPAGDTAPAQSSKIEKNLAIAYYDASEYPAALEAIERSLSGGVEADKIELKAAILEEMKRFDDAMNTYRAHLKEKEFKPKVTYWINEIVRLKKEKKKAGGSK